MASKLFFLGPLLLLAFMLRSAESLQWYEKNHPYFLSSNTFNDHITKDRSQYKIVKFFTPSCKYCRYLKNDIDQLKSQKQWNIRFYDLNCDRDYDFCSNYMKISSYPHTMVFDAAGMLVDEIHGYYNKDIMRQVFQNIEELSNAPPASPKHPISTSSTPSAPQLKKNAQVQAIILPAQKQMRTTDVQTPKMPQNDNQKTIHYDHKREKAIPTVLGKIQNAQKQSAPEKHSFNDAESAKTQSTSIYSQVKSLLLGCVKYFFYGVCLMAAVFYIRKITALEKSQHQIISPNFSHTLQINVKNKQKRQQDSNLMKMMSGDYM